jgi:DNA polymerase I-like protein with 3'-5' exonuclease and polymerase domains
VKVLALRAPHRARCGLSAFGLADRLQIEKEEARPEGEVERAAEIVQREMAGAVEMDPPREVDVGAGRNWLKAK